MNQSSARYPQYPNPNPNPNPNTSFHSLPGIPNPNFATPYPIPPPPVLDLSATVSSLESLLAHATETINSLSQTLGLNTDFLKAKSENDDFVPCPFNRHHVMPPESLFLHSLHCPSPLDLTSYVSLLNYPKTLKSAAELQQKAHFIQSLQEPKCNELCFSLDDYLEFGSNFFYQGCPGVVNFSDVDNAKKMFTLPEILYVECANMVGIGETWVKYFPSLKALPSDLWEVRSEIHRWGDYPSAYSFSAVHAILGLRIVEGSGLKKWVISNSPRYGVVIDVYMRDHIIVLFNLCLKAIVREAIALVVDVGDIKGKEPERSLKTKSFNCPVLVQVMIWLTSQFSVLYGEVNGKFFAVNMLKHCILESASTMLLLPLTEKMVETPKSSNIFKRLETDRIDVNDIKLEDGTDERSAENELFIQVKDSGEGSLIFVSQVAAAVAALHERALLEGKIRGLRLNQPLTRYQRMAEHEFMTKRAFEEKNKRPNYRPIIEHDGLPRQKSSNQDTNRPKTRDELLAEERDYKRRRMSYRGKKVKRTTLQVMREIIEGYMEEIKQAGGIGCFEKGDDEEAMLLLKPAPGHNFAVNTDELQEIDGDTSESARGYRSYYGKDLGYYDNNGSTTYTDPSAETYVEPKRVHHGQNDHLLNDIDRRWNNRDRHSTDYSYGSMKRRQSHSRSEKNDHEMGRDDAESNRTNHHNIKTPRSHSRSYKQYDRETRRDDAESTRTNHHNIKRLSSSVDHRSSSHYISQRNSQDKHSLDSQLQNTFEDRYNPSESKDVLQDDAFTGKSSYGKP